MLYPWRSTWVRLVAAAVGCLAAAILAVTVLAAPVYAHIALDSATAATGSTVEGSGSGFSPFGSAVQLHLDQPAAPALWSGAADRGGAVAFSFTVPSVASGSHSIVATQTGRDREPTPGTPATAVLRITAAAAASPAATQAGTGNQQKQPQAPGASAASTARSTAAVPATVSSPQTTGPLAAGSPVVFSLPTHAAARLPNPPPQVATMWRVDGAVPRVATVAAPVAARATPAPVTSTGERAAPSVPALAALAVLVGAAIVLIATTLQLRRGHAPTPEVAASAPRRQRGQRRGATVRSPDLWSGSPARLR